MNNPIKFIDLFGLWTVGDDGLYYADAGDSLESFAEFMNLPVDDAIDLLLDQGIDPEHIGSAVYNPEFEYGAISPSYINSGESAEFDFRYLSGPFSFFGALNPFTNPMDTFRIRNSFGGFSCRIYNGGKFFGNQYITKDMIYQGKPFYYGGKCLSFVGSAMSLLSIKNSIYSYIGADTDEDKIFCIIDATGGIVGLFPGCLPAIMSFFITGENYQRYIEQTSYYFEVNPYYTPTGF